MKELKIKTCGPMMAIHLLKTYALGDSISGQPTLFKLVTRLTLENNDPDVQSWLKEDSFMDESKKIVERLQTNQRSRPPI